MVHPIPCGPDLADTDSLSAKLAAADAVLAGLSSGPADLSVSPLAPAPAAPAVAFAADSVAGGAPVLTPPQAPPSASGSDARSAVSAPSPGGRTAPVLTPPRPPSSCGHPSSAGQELCYLCHQRSRRNVPVSFTDELRRRELEEDRLLQAYQFMRDREKIINEQVRRGSESPSLFSLSSSSLFFLSSSLPLLFSFPSYLCPNKKGAKVRALLCLLTFFFLLFSHRFLTSQKAAMLRRHQFKSQAAMAFVAR